STNKGMLNFFFTAPSADPAACRLSPRSAVTGTLFTHFYVDDPADTIREWFVRTLQAADVAELSLEAHYDRQPERVYLLGISNGGHVVRRMLSEFPTRFDGGVDWEGVYWSPAGPSILIDLPVALRNWEPYVASGFSRQSAAFQAMLGAGYPPDILARPPPPGAPRCTGTTRSRTAITSSGTARAAATSRSSSSSSLTLTEPFSCSSTGWSGAPRPRRVSASRAAARSWRTPAWRGSRSGARRCWRNEPRVAGTQRERNWSAWPSGSRARNASRDPSGPSGRVTTRGAT